MKLEQDNTHFGIISAVLGSLAMAAWLIPIAGAVCSVGALLTGVRAVDSDRNGWAWAGIVLGAAGVILTLVRSGLVVYYG